MAPHLSFQWPQEALAGIVALYTAFLASIFYELHHTPETLVVQLHHRIILAPSGREHGEHSPPLQPHRDKHLLYLVELVVVSLIYAGYHVKGQVIAGCYRQLDGFYRPLVASFTAPHPVVRLLQAVQAHRHGMQAGSHQPPEPVRSHCKAVCYHSPRETLLDYLAPAFLQVFAHQRLSSGQYHQDMPWVIPDLLAISLY